MTKTKTKPAPVEQAEPAPVEQAEPAPVEQAEPAPAPTEPERPTHINGVEVEYVKMNDSGMVLQKFVQKSTKDSKE